MQASLAAAPRSLVERHRYADLVTTLAARTLKVRYRGSVLGVFWSLSNPLLMTLIYELLFGAAFSQYYGNSRLNYVLAVFVALAVLSFFSTSTSQALTSIVANGGLLNKMSIPYSAFPVSVIAANAFQLCAGTLPLLLLVTLYRTHSVWHVVALAGPLAGLILICLGFGFALAVVYVYFRDIPYLYEVFTFVLYMTTPVFYPAQLVPASVRGYLALNPIAGIVEAVRTIALSPQPIAPSLIVSSLGVGCVAFAGGWLVLAAMRRDVVDLL
ncbi:MAG: ABC transporter permease [Candidatus Velthaea sp.]